jgi:serine/threonine-protein kinase
MQDSANSDVVDPLWQRVLNDRFTVLEPIGRGGMGTVYRAIQSPLDRVVALKVLNSAPHLDPGFRQRFFMEASMTSKLRHPNTVTVIDYGETPDGIFYLVMEYLEGKPLSQVLSESKLLHWTRCLNIGQQICRSLRGAHKLGVVHRDLKPSNVMLLNEDGEHDAVKVLDFGLVKSFIQDKEPKGEATDPGIFVGSPSYMAPEQLRGRADPRADVYSLGVLLYQMLVGRPPFVARDAIDVMYQHVYSAPLPLHSVCPELKLGPKVESLVMKCLEKQTSRRFQSMDEVLEALRSAAGKGAGNIPPGFSTDLGRSAQGQPAKDSQAQRSLQTAQAESHSRAASGQQWSEAESHVGPPETSQGDPHPHPLRPEAIQPPQLADDPNEALSKETTEPTLAIDIDVASSIPKARLARLLHNATKPPLVFPALLLLVGSMAVPIIFIFRGGNQTAALTVRPSDPVRVFELKQPALAPRAEDSRQSDRAMLATVTRPAEARASEPAVNPAAKSPAADLVLPERPRNDAPRVIQMQKSRNKAAPAAKATEPEKAMVAPESESSSKTEVAMLSPSTSSKAPGAPDAPSSGPPAAVTPPSPPVALAAAQGLPPAHKERLQLDESNVQLSKISGPDPEYTPKALDADVEGLMLVKCTVTVQGAVQGCRVLKGLPFMDRAVVSALEQRRYKPYLLGGKPTEIDYTFKIKLNLPR